MYGNNRHHVSGEVAVASGVLFFVTWFLQAKTWRRWVIGFFGSLCTAFAALSWTDVYPPEPGPGEITVGFETVYHYAWWGWASLLLLAYLLCMLPKVVHHVEWHSYQKRPGLFTKTIETEKFNWLGTGTVHAHGCRQPSRQDWGAYEQAQREATYAPQTVVAPPTIVHTAPTAFERPIAPKAAPAQPRATETSPHTQSKRPAWPVAHRTEDHGTFMINDYRGFDPEAGE